MKTWDTLYPRVLPRIVGLGIPNPTVDQQILEASQEFCRRTRAWRVALDPFVTVAAVSEYQLELPAGTSLVRLEFAKVAGQEFLVLNDDNHDDYRRNLSVGFGDTGPQAVFSDVPSAGASVILTVTVRPSDDATGMADSLFTDYGEALAAGALARLRPDAYPEQVFISKCNDIRLALWRGRSATTPRTRARFF